MANSKSAKRAFVSSAIAVLLCVVMLIGTTFAWFTDTAKTGVNKIQSGTLAIELQMKDKDGNWVNAEGKTLDFRKSADAPEGEAVLWEPGCTYELPELRVVNNGNLALKYKIVVSGITGDAKLLEAIEFIGLDDIGDVEHVNNNIVRIDGVSSNFTVDASDNQWAKGFFPLWEGQPEPYWLAYTY